MATLNIRIDDDIKHKACLVLDEMNVSQSDAVRVFFEYIATYRQLPIKTLVVDNDDDLIDMVKHRLKNPEPSFEVDLDAL
ncbi:MULTISPECIES: type II toxin-antitoxin system RelB/DinJ family antitoxin [unclassified Moraxella]|uniref:type II toxin-antitoxin system RelB/DinJ family antitoxin n=1 Tax=unclassified Moraxella TaxID=2685852 RepID=UPI003AF57CF9